MTNEQETETPVKSVLRVPVSGILKDVQRYMNNSMMSINYYVDVHSVKVERKGGVDMLVVEVSKRVK